MDKSKNIFITGVSRGLGYGFAQYYLERSDTDNKNKVFGVSRKPPEQIKDHSDFRWRPCDLSLYTTIKNCLRNEFLPAKIDLIVLNAGILGEIKDMVDTSLEDIQKVMNINLWANKAILDYLLNNHYEITQVIAISSGASVSGNRGWNAYGISKAALNMMIKLYAAENPGIHFTSLAPGLIDTQMQDYIYEIPDEKKFTTVKRLREARGTDDMPDPQKAAERITPVFEQLLNYDSGSFIDIRKME